MGSNAKSDVRTRPCVAWFLFFLLLLGGCGSAAKRTTPDELAQIQLGVSTKQDVVRLLGLPNRRESKGSGSRPDLEYWVYHKKGTKVSTILPLGAVATGGYVVTFIGTIPANERENIAAVLAFDGRGVLVDMITEGAFDEY